MKKFLFVVLAACMMLVAFSGCKKAADPASLFKQMIDIAAANDGDCKKAADEVKKFYDANKDVWLKGLKDLKAAGKSDEEIEKIMTGNDEAVVKKAEGLKCGHGGDELDVVSGEIMMELAKSVM